VNPFQAAVLGLVQGLAEFLPISSSAHLIIVPWLLGWHDPAINSLAFDVALHMGTLVAVLAYFWQDWVNIIRGALHVLVTRRVNDDPQGKLAVYILLATIPGVIAGLLLESKIDESFHSADPNTQATGIAIIAVMLILLAVVLFLAERMARHIREITQISLGTAMAIGFAQALAVIPGVSRSGSTITAGLFAGLKREAAARFSFLLGTPIIVGSGLKKGYDVLKAGGIPSADQLGFLIGFVVAAISGYAAIWLLLRFLQRNNTLPFVAYRVVVGVLLLLLVIFGFRGL
jgi:undecaprenyl-diphosphatase